MKKLLTLIAIIIAAGQLAAQDLSPDQIISNHLKTIGQDKLMKMETIKMTGKMTQQGIDMLVTQYEKKPKKTRQDIEVQGMTISMAVNGETGWMINPMMGSPDPQDLPAEALKSLEKESESDPTVSWDNPFVTWKEDGTKVELAGKEDVNGSAAYNLKFTYKEGNSVNYIIDAAKFLLLKTKSTENAQGQTFDRELRYSDFRDYDGVLIPGKIEILVNGQVGQVFTTNKCEFNIPIDDSLFNKPVKN